MGTFNWIVVSGTCPCCHQLVSFDAQTHVASSYDGDDAGRFHDVHYQLGEPMRWWQPEHKDYKEWRANGKMGADIQGNEDWECCYAECPVCKVEVYVLIRFDGPRSLEVEQIGLDSNWPEGYWK